MSEEKKNRVERVAFWIGSILAIVVSVFTVYEKFIALKGPELVITFFESNSHNLYLFPSVETRIETTEEIPLQLKIANTGEKVAKNIKLYISHYPNISLVASYKKEEKRTWNTPNDVMKQVSLNIEDINPGESFFIPITLKLKFPKEFQEAVRAKIKDISDEKLLVPRSYTLYCDLSSETSVSVSSELTVVLGNLDVLKERNHDIYWIGHGADGVKILKVADDFPKD